MLFSFGSLGRTKEFTCTSLLDTVLQQNPHFSAQICPDLDETVANQQNNKCERADNYFSGKCCDFLLILYGF